MNKKLPLLIFRAVALGLGLGVVTLTGMNKMDSNDAMKLLGLGLTCLAACSFGEEALKSQKENVASDIKNLKIILDQFDKLESTFELTDDINTRRLLLQTILTKANPIPLPSFFLLKDLSSCTNLLNISS